MQVIKEKPTSTVKKFFLIGALIFFASILLTLGINTLAPSNTRGELSIAEIDPESEQEQYPVPEQDLEAEGESEQEVESEPELVRESELGDLSPEDIFAYNVDAVFKIYAADNMFEWMGSGFFICETGIAVTNHHVIQDASFAVIVTEDGREFDIVGYYSYDLNNDLAIIQVDGDREGFPYVTMGDSDALRVGEEVFTIGSPGGDHNTFFRTYIARFVPEFLLPGIPPIVYDMRDVIQITAPIYGGSSGGAMFNTKGEAVGITTAINPSRPTIAFAVPISRVDLSQVVAGDYSPLPLTVGSASQPNRNNGGDLPHLDLQMYSGFPNVPDFGDLSSNATFIEEGNAFADFNIDVFRVENNVYILADDHILVYHISERHFFSDIMRFESYLFELGYNFISASYCEVDDIDAALFIHPTAGTEVSILYSMNTGELMIVIGQP